MKKIDFHIHTVPTISDSSFTFSLETFQRYVDQQSLDAVAVTNHDVFDAVQFRVIQQSLKAVVFPGIEINLEKGHILLIGSASAIDDFESKATLVSQKLVQIGDFLTVEELLQIYGDLSRYLVIPHYDKAPALSTATLEKLKQYICAGEVDSAKKFVRVMKDPAQLSPVLFSDARMRTDLAALPTRCTYIDCGDISIGALNACLRDKSKLALSAKDGNKLWPVFENGQQLSTGLNVVIGARSSGKTHTLNEIRNRIEHVKYIEQFSLVQQNEAGYEREFKSGVEKKRSVFVDDYLSGLKRVLDEVMEIDSVANTRRVERFVETLLKSADDADRNDAFSKATLFNEVDFPLDDPKTLVELIESVRQVIENVEFRSTIEKHVDLGALRKLALELIQLLWARQLENSKKSWANSLVKEVKQNLKVRTAAVQVEDVDLYDILMDDSKIQRFRTIVTSMKREAVILDESIQGFRVEARRGPFSGALEIRDASGTRVAFSDAYQKYDDPYDYLRELINKDQLSRAELYRLFVKIGYRVLNKDGFEVSGGERSEFRLLQEIADAQNFDILLIDEPESSFDNLFLNSDVNQLLKAISEVMPVVVVTHNNTVGASVGADYLLYTKKEIEGGIPVYRIYSGYPTDRQLLSIDGKSVANYEITMDSLEAGVTAYERRRLGYEATNN